MYSLEYGMMVQTLRQLGFSGEFQADLPSHPVLRGGGRVVLLVRDGHVLSCFILDRNGQKIYHDAEAHQLLPRFGIVDWKLISSNSGRSAHAGPPPFAPPGRPPVGPPETPRERYRSFFPQRLTVSEAQWRAWSTLERAVYSLADGTHTIEQIAVLLSRPLPAIEQIIRNFESLGIIMRLS
jgi:hypothetical protein